MNINCVSFLAPPLLQMIFYSSLLFLQGCQSSPEITREPTHFSKNVMTIDYHISVGDKISQDDRKRIQSVIDQTFQEIDAIYNKWNSSSEISKINALPAHVPHQLSPQLEHFFHKVDLLVNLSEGRFDPTIEPIQHLWKEKMERGTSPSPSEMEAIRPCIGWHNVHIANGVIYKEHGETKIDLGGVAKGYCVDLLIERIHELGINHLYVEWGGEIRTLGFHPLRRPWRIFISRLGDPTPSQAIAQIELIDRALATSGDYYQFWKIQTESGEEKIYSHIINPLTQFPLESKPGSIASASLLALDCMTADALAKVLMLFDSPEEAQQWLKKLQQNYPELACWIAARN